MAYIILLPKIVDWYVIIALVLTVIWGVFRGLTNPPPPPEFSRQKPKQLTKKEEEKREEMEKREKIGKNVTYFPICRQSYYLG
mgnify:CR=1 FL=1